MIKGNNTKKGRGVRIRTLSYGILVIACTILIVLVVSIFRISKSYQDMQSAMDSYVQAQDAIQDLKVSSDKMSEIAKEYVVTMDSECIYSYFEAFEDKEEKVKAVYALKNSLFRGNTTIGIALEAAMSDSNQVMELELHSMRLIAMLKNVDIRELPEELQEYELSEEELAYTDQQLQDGAYYLLFDANFADCAQQMDDDINDAWAKITDLTMQNRQDCEAVLESAIRQQEVCMIVLFLMIAALFLMITFFIVRPLDYYVECIEEQKPLEALGARELRYLAETYNQVLEKNTVSKVELTHEAQHDALTGLMNRGAFDKLKGYLKETFEPMALLLLDVDNFKGVNDNYGHECGDEALKKVAGLLRENFRSDDYPARIGGDEFAVIMTKITPGEKDTIRKKVDAINSKLGVAENGIPKLSLSVGIAFSQLGYNDELYSKADSALYKTKENGKCGYTFYGDWK
jgi:diguanylate cyclase (GGDEF)-like protein